MKTKGRVLRPGETNVTPIERGHISWLKEFSGEICICSHSKGLHDLPTSQNINGDSRCLSCSCKKYQKKEVK